MDYAMNRPWWLMMSDLNGPGRPRGGPGGRGDRRRREGFGPRTDHDQPDQEGRRGPGPGGFGPGGYGPGGPFPGPFPHGPGGRHRRGGRARRGDVRAAILALLAEEPSNGYQIIQALHDRTNGVWKPSPGAVYPALAQLEDEHLIEAFDNAGAKAFRLTEEGSAAAAGIDPKPWDLVNQESGATADGAAALWQELGALATAARAVLSTGTADQVQAAIVALADTRKRLFGILAGDPED